MPRAARATTGYTDMAGAVTSARCPLLSTAKKVTDDTPASFAVPRAFASSCTMGVHDYRIGDVRGDPIR